MNLAWTPAECERVLVFDKRLYWCLRMQGGRAAEQCCSLFSCHRREWTTCSTCWIGYSWTSGFSPQRKWCGFLAPCFRPPLVSGSALPPGFHLHCRTHWEKAAADSASIWTGAVCPTSCWPGQTCTLGWKPSAGFWTCTLCHQLQNTNTPVRKHEIHIRYVCIWNLSLLLRPDLEDLCLIHVDCPDTQDCPLSSLPETVMVASDSWLLRTSSSLSLSWRLLWFSDFLFQRQQCSAETHNISINQDSSVPMRTDTRLPCCFTSYQSRTISELAPFPLSNSISPCR